MTSGLFVITALAQLFLSHAIQKTCDDGRDASISVKHTLNSTGHPQIYASDNLNGQLEVDYQPSSFQEEIKYSAYIHISRSGLDQQVSPKECVPNKGPPSKRRVHPGYVLIPSLGYVRSVAKALTWTEALAECEAEGASLPMPRNAVTGEALASIIHYGVAGRTNPDWAWLGGNDFEEEGRWVTSDGLLIANVSSMKWFPNEPNFKREENCMVFVKISGLLGDAPCTWKLPFACYIPLSQH